MFFHYFQRFELFKIHQKVDQKLMQIWIRKIKTKNRSKDRFGSVLGSIWEGFGALWGLFWALLAAFGPFFWRSKPNFYKALVQDGLQEAFWMDSGSIWGGFGEDLGRSWEDLGSQNWNFCVTGSSLEHFVCPLVPHILLQESPRCLASPRGASQYSGANVR